MTSTPPPQQRARTPPTPLHGAKHDAYEPFSPRRSSRIHSKQTPQYPQGAYSSSHGLHQPLGKSSTAMQRSKPTLQRTSSQTFSPPPSPRPSERKGRMYRVVEGSHHQRTRPQIFMDGAGSDDELAANHNAASRNGMMLPTPSKTPRKRDAPAKSTLASTARVLFPGRTMHPDDVLPSPRKARRQSKKTAFSLESFAEACDNGGSKIEIYTDSKERVPELDESEDNPFISKKSDKTPLKQPKKRSKHGMGQAIDEAVENDEGMVYVFRGKKVFRRFSGQAEEDSMDDLGSDEEVVNERDARQASRTGGKRFTRSAVKPRLLFPPKAQDCPSEGDEEAPTDIEDELAIATPQPEDQFAATPQKSSYHPNTPPPTTHKARRDAALTPDSSPIAPTTDKYQDELAMPRAVRPSKKSPFDSWQRTKPHVQGPTAPAKRQGEAMENHQSPKRSRSSAQTQQTS